MSQLKILPAKAPAEKLPVEFYFLDKLAVGESITGELVSIGLFSGEDPDPEAILSGLPTHTEDTVSQLIIDGLAGVIYTLICSVVTSDSNVFTQTARLAVVTPGGRFS